MIEIPFVLSEILFALLWILLRLVVWIRQKRIDRKREGVLLLLYIDLAVLLRFVFFPLERAGGQVKPLLFDAGAILPLRVNLIPFVRLFDFASKRDLLLNVIGNVAMFIPSGIVLPVVYPRLDSFRKVIAAGAGISLCIELMQLPFRVRSTDIDDLILNTLGVMIGFGIYALVRRIRRAKP